jgi:hypothetical protein
MLLSFSFRRAAFVMFSSSGSTLCQQLAKGLPDVDVDPMLTFG